MTRYDWATNGNVTMSSRGAGQGRRTYMSDPDKPKRPRRDSGSGSIYRIGDGRVWYVAYRDASGKRVIESTKSTSRTAAERLLRKRTGARDNGLPVVPRAEQLTFERAAQLLLDNYRAKNNRSTASVERRLRLHLRPFFAGRRMASITVADITAYIAKRKQTEFVVKHAKLDKDGTVLVPEVRRCPTPAEVNRELATLRRMFWVAIEGGLLAQCPPMVMQREQNARQGFFEEADLHAICKHLAAPLRPVLITAFITGWRCRSEILPMKWSQVDLEGGEIRLPAGVGKTGEPRTFPMTDQLRRVFEERWGEHQQMLKVGFITPFVFVRWNGTDRPKEIRSFHRAFVKARRAAGLPGKIVHDFRRTACRNLIRAGVAERVAMQLSGHKTRSVFERYNIVNASDLRDAVAKLNRMQPTLAEVRQA